MRIAFFFSVGTLLAGCAYGASQSGAMPALPNSHAAQPARTASLYAGGPNANDVDVYREFQNDPQPRRHITAALDAPTGMAVDAAGNLFVCNNAGQTVPGKSVFWTVTVYHPGAGMPFRTYTAGVFSPVDVAVAADGTVYVANDSSEVTVYPTGSLQPSKMLRAPAGDAPIGVALDARGDVFVSYVPRSSSGGRIYEYQAGRARGHDLGIAFSANPMASRLTRAAISSWPSATLRALDPTSRCSRQARGTRRRLSPDHFSRSCSPSAAISAGSSSRTTAVARTTAPSLSTRIPPAICCTETCTAQPPARTASPSATKASDRRTGRRAAVAAAFERAVARIDDDDLRRAPRREPAKRVAHRAQLSRRRVGKRAGLVLQARRAATACGCAARRRRPERSCRIPARSRIVVKHDRDDARAAGASRYHAQRCRLS